MTPEEKEEIRRRCEAATEGPWSRDNPPLDHEGCQVWPWDRAVDMEFAYAAREDMPRLLAHIEALEAERDRLREALRECADDLHAEIAHRSTPVVSMRPDERLKYERDMEPVYRARKLLEATDGR